MNIEQGVPLGRLTTVGIGGPARHFARPATVGELEEALRWAATEGLDVFTIGLGSNVLVADEGVDSLALRLEGELAAAETRDSLLVAGGGAANAVCLHRTRAAGLGGFEFACAIPGTVGGGVRMNAGAYGGDWRGILERALVVAAEGSYWRTPDELGLEYRRSALKPGEVVAQAEFRLGREAARRDQGDSRRSPGEAQGCSADEQAHVRQRLQEPRARAVRGPHARGGRTQGAPDRRRPDLSPTRQLHRERGRRAGRWTRSR